MLCVDDEELFTMGSTKSRSWAEKAPPKRGFEHLALSTGAWSTGPAAPAVPSAALSDSDWQAAG
jgi:hypothetical protein